MADERSKTFNDSVTLSELEELRKEWGAEDVEVDIIVRDVGFYEPYWTGYLVVTPRSLNRE